MLTAGNIALAIGIAVVVGVVIWWVSRWKFPIPTKLTCEVKAVQEEAKQFTLQLQVEKVDFDPPADLFERWARPTVVKNAPKANQPYTFRVPKEKMRATLKAGDHVVIAGRVLQPLAGGIADLSIHESRPVG